MRNHLPYIKPKVAKDFCCLLEELQIFWCLVSWSPAQRRKLPLLYFVDWTENGIKRKFIVVPKDWEPRITLFLSIGSLAPSTESRLLSGCSSLSCSPSTGEVEAGMSGTEASLSYRSDFKANLSYMIPSLKTQTRKATSSQPSGISTFPMMVFCKLLKPTASLGTRNPISLFWHPHPQWLPLISQEDFTFLPWFFLSLFYKNNALFSYVVKSCYRIWLSNCISCLSVSSMLLPTLN